MARFIFVAGDGAEIFFDVQAEAGKIEAIAAHLRQRIRTGAVVGLLFRSEPNLLINWFASVAAGLRPLVLQYPTRKQSRAYWLDSVSDTLATASVSAVIADDHCSTLGLAGVAATISQTDLDALQPEEGSWALPEDFAIVQLSSGTTGFRKAMQFTAADLIRHTHDFNRTLQLEPGRDRVVSWLPLYHDMGYVACFVMPVLLGVDVVMMDPIDWVRQPGLLLSAIERHRGTICYMPNFGFEVMAREISNRATAPDLSSVRHWISCSEPVSATTSSKFIEVSGVDPRSFKPCYAMAENIFAVSLGDGLSTAQVDEADVVSCGAPIPGVETKIVDGEIWVRSPTSLVSYLDGKDIRDADGFYPTGDLGALIGGQLYVSGRKQDLLIQAGRKFVMSDIDLRLNELYPEVRGRAATLAIRDDRLGTEVPTILIEADDFFDRTDAPEIAAAVRDATGLDQVQVVFVPPRFITKTSSGKINRRKTRGDWIAARETMRRRSATARDPVAELRASFLTASWDLPVSKALDSLSTVVLRIILDACAVKFDPSRTLEDYAASLAKPNEALETERRQGVRIVSLADRNTMRTFRRHHVEALADALNCPVTFEHVCLPPSPVLISDLVFHDYFQPRLDQEPFAAVDRAMEKLKGASLILLDDRAEMFFLRESTYPALSHALERNPESDLIVFRWPDYVRNHDRIPLTVVSGSDLPLTASNIASGQLSRYLDTPIFRIARFSAYDEFTTDWEFRASTGGDLQTLDAEALSSALLDWIKENSNSIKEKCLPENNFVNNDPIHFCSHKVVKKTIDVVLENFGSFIIAGQTSSAPYVRKELERKNKKFIYVTSYAPEMLEKLADSYECLLICGAMGPLETSLPTVALEHIGPSKRGFFNFSDEEFTSWPVNELAISSDGWFRTFELDREQSKPYAAAARLKRPAVQDIGDDCSPQKMSPPQINLQKNTIEPDKLKLTVDAYIQELKSLPDNKKRRLLRRAMREAVVEIRKALQENA